MLAKAGRLSQYKTSIGKGALASIMESAVSATSHTIPDNPENSLTRAEEARRKQVEEVGSEALYKRLDKKLALLEVDPFFYRKQMKMFELRYKVLQENTRYNQLEISFLVTQRFDQVLHELEHHQPSQEIHEISLNTGKEAEYKFSAPQKAKDLLVNLHHEENKTVCKCKDCKVSIQAAWEVIRDTPEAGPLTELAIRVCRVQSLQDVCLARVVELGLQQDDLPLTLRDSLRRGPGLATDGKGERAVEVLQKVVKDLEPKIQVIKQVVLDTKTWLVCLLKSSKIISYNTIILEIRLSKLSKIVTEEEYLEKSAEILMELKYDGCSCVDEYYRETIKKKLLDLASQMTNNPNILPKVDFFIDPLSLYGLC